MAPPIRWRVADPELVWRHWNDEDEWVAFSPLSASVHLLNPSARLLVQAAAGRALSIDECTATLAGLLDRPVDEEFAVAVRETIVGLDRAGLLEPVSA